MEKVTRNARSSFQGVVISDKNDKTIVVLIETHRKHPKYGKRVKYAKKYYVHDEKNAAHVGDTVTIAQTRPLSKTKRFRLVSIDKKGISSVKVNETELDVNAKIKSVKESEKKVVEEKLKKLEEAKEKTEEENAKKEEK